MLSNLSIMLTTIITNLYISTGLLGIVLAMALESCCIPLPSEIVLPVAGLLFAQHRLLPGTETYLGIFLLGLSGAIGCVIGSMIAYWIGFKGGRPLMLKYGRYVLISQHDADKADAFFQRWGSPTAFFSRLLPVVRTYISLPAGITKMPFIRFCVYSFCGSLPWCIMLAYAGVVLQNNMKVIEPIYKDVEYVVIVAIVLLVALYIWRHLRNDRLARAAHTQSSTEEQPSMPPVQQPYSAGNQFQQPWKQSSQSNSNGQQSWQQQQQASSSQPPRWQ